MEGVQVPLDLLKKVVRLAESFGEPNFFVVVGAGDGSENGVEEGRVAVFDAEVASVATYRAKEVSHAERLRDLLNTVTGDLAEILRAASRDRLGR